MYIDRCQHLSYTQIWHNFLLGSFIQERGLGTAHAIVMRMRNPTGGLNLRVNIQAHALTGNRLIIVDVHLFSHHWPCGLMDKASDFGSEDCEFESRRGRNKYFCIFCNNHK